jgi:hypothetical protein
MTFVARPLTCGCTLHRKANVSDGIAQQIQAGATQVDTAHTKDFLWDEVYVFQSPFSERLHLRNLETYRAPQCSAAGTTEVGEGEFPPCEQRGCSSALTALVPAERIR